MPLVSVLVLMSSVPLYNIRIMSGWADEKIHIHNEEPPLGACDVKLDPLPNLESESGIFHVLLFSY